MSVGTIPPSASPLNLGAALLAGGQYDRLPFLRLHFTLNTDPTRSRTPTLLGYRVLFDCTDGS